MGGGNQGNIGKNTHVPLDLELPLYTGGLVCLWEVGERKGSFPVPSNYACDSFKSLPKLPTITFFQKQSIGKEVTIAKAAA